MPSLLQCKEILPLTQNDSFWSGLPSGIQDTSSSLYYCQSNLFKLLHMGIFLCVAGILAPSLRLHLWYDTGQWVIPSHNPVWPNCSRKGNSEAGQGPLLWIPDFYYKEFTQNLNLELTEVHLNTTLKSDTRRVEITLSFPKAL